MKSNKPSVADIWDAIVFTFLAIVVLYLFMFLTPNVAY
jgi:hypothetical protein